MRLLCCRWQLSRVVSQPRVPDSSSGQEKRLKGQHYFSSTLQSHSLACRSPERSPKTPSIITSSWSEHHRISRDSGVGRTASFRGWASLLTLISAERQQKGFTLGVGSLRTFGIGGVTSPPEPPLRVCRSRKPPRGATNDSQLGRHDGRA